MRTHVAEEVLLTPPREHGVCHGSRIGIVQRGDDLGLVSADGIEPGDLTAVEVATVGVVGDEDPSVAEQVVVSVTRSVLERDPLERRGGFLGRGSLEVGEDVEAGSVEPGEELRAPSTPVEADRRTCICTQGLSNLGHDDAQLRGECRPRWSLEDQEPVSEAVRHPGVHLGWHGDAHPGHVGLGDLGFAVVGADVTVDVEQADGVGMGICMATGESQDEFVRPVLIRQFSQSETEPVRLGGPVETEEPPDGCGIQSCEPLSTWLPHHGCEHDTQDERAQAVVGGEGDARDASTGAVGGGCDVQGVRSQTTQEGR